MILSALRQLDETTRWACSEARRLSRYRAAKSKDELRNRVNRFVASSNNFSHWRAPRPGQGNLFYGLPTGGRGTEDCLR